MYADSGRSCARFLQFKDDILDLLAVGTLMIASRQGEPPSIQTTESDLEAITGMQVRPYRYLCITELKESNLRIVICLGDADDPTRFRRLGSTLRI
jgi:hypothetical protein